MAFPERSYACSPCNGYRRHGSVLEQHVQFRRQQQHPRKNEVAEASVVLNAFSADYGRMAGAQLNFVGKTGTYAYHGNAYHNHNDKILNANDFFNNQAGLQAPRSEPTILEPASASCQEEQAASFVNYESLRYALPRLGDEYFDLPRRSCSNTRWRTRRSRALPLDNSAFTLWNSSPGAKNAQPVTNRQRSAAGWHNPPGFGTAHLLECRHSGSGRWRFGTTGPSGSVDLANTSEINGRACSPPAPITTSMTSRSSTRATIRLGRSGHRPELHQSGVEPNQQPALRTPGS